MQRCSWATNAPPYYQKYHDEEWGVPVHDDRHLFEMLILEGAQAGLSWDAILRRREGYRAAFQNFNPIRVAAMTDAELEQILLSPTIIRNRLKVYSARKNAAVFLQIQQEFGSFNTYLWNFVGNQPILNAPAPGTPAIITSPQSDKLSTDLKKRGMSFVGSTILYAYMQAVGLVNDHTTTCFCSNRKV